MHSIQKNKEWEKLQAEMNTFLSQRAPNTHSTKTGSTSSNAVIFD